MGSCKSIVLATSLFVQASMGEIIWSSVVITGFGERVPLLSPNYSVITPVGAQQLFQAGTSFRSRYLQGDGDNNTIINGISINQLDNIQTFAVATSDVWVSQSATAFVQGLYPPTSQLSTSTISQLANGSSIESPLNGYQYANVYTTYAFDPSIIYLNGHNDCPGYDAASSNYLSSPAGASVESKTATFWQSFYHPVFEGASEILSSMALNYGNAYDLFDYISFAYNHNSTVRSLLSDDQISQVRYLADELVFGENSNTSTSSLSAIAGRTLAAQVLGGLQQSIDTAGFFSKLRLLFTEYEPMVALLALIGIPSLDSRYTGLPNLGASMVFELFSIDEGESKPSAGHLSSTSIYPAESELFVRFLLKNGTDTLETLPLFGNVNPHSTLPWQDFKSAVQNLELGEAGVWCEVCGSALSFCANAMAGASPGGNATSHAEDQTGAQRPAIAGIIGALIALAIAAVMMALLFLIGGFRMARLRPGLLGKRNSQLGGFKGTEKLASDVDLTKDQGAMGISGVGGDAAASSHKRIESWELREGKKTAEGRPRLSFEDDGMSIRGHVQGVKATESV